MSAWLRHPAARVIVACVVMALGFAGSAGLLVLFHSAFFDSEETETVTAVNFDAPPPKKKPPAKKKPKPKPKPKPRPTAAPPPPSLGSALAGMSFGLPQFQGDLLGDASDGMLGDRSDAIMSEDSVDEAPRPTKRAGAVYPTRARQDNVEGFVTFSLLVKADGAVSDIRILDADPPGVFDQVAMEAIRQWAFEPAYYEGAPVSVRIRQTFRFNLD
ncbi:MAG: energy transducer TonB [Myxococcota bacterium]